MTASATSSKRSIQNLDISHISHGTFKITFVEKLVILHSFMSKKLIIVNLRSLNYCKILNFSTIYDAVFKNNNV